MRPDDERSGVDADADLELLAELGLERGVNVVEGDVDGAHGAERLAAAGLEAAALTEHCKKTIAEVLVDASALVGDRATDDAEELVQNEDDVEG